MASSPSLLNLLKNDAAIIGSPVRKSPPHPITFSLPNNFQSSSELTDQTHSLPSQRLSLLVPSAE